jgi:hypothetical protein
MLSVLPEEQCHRGLGPGLSCLAGAPAALVKGALPASCDSCDPTTPQCRLECSDSRLQLDAMLGACVQGASAAELAAAKAYRKRRGQVGVVVSLEAN